MINTGLIGGGFGYRVLRRVGGPALAEARNSGIVYAKRSKLEALFGPRIWAEIAGKDVIDFGCGIGQEAIEMAQHGARRVIGIDNRQKVLDIAALDARRLGLERRCQFRLETAEQADVIFSIDGFEHYSDPALILRLLHGLVRPDGRVFICFGPPWLHPLGGHLFSVFPWAHLIFTEPALIRWRSDFKFDGATRFGEVEGGLNQMTIGRFESLVTDSDFQVEMLETVPIRRFKPLFNPLTREFLTAVVRCTLRPKPVSHTAA